MSYTPTSSEIVISGVDIYSGGENWGPEDVVIPATVSSPSQFYVKSATDGSLIEVDAETAAQLYASSIAIADLNELYGPGQAYSYPLEWQQTVNQIQIGLQGETLLNFAEDFASDFAAFLPEAVGLAVPGVDVVAAIGLATGVISAFLTEGAANYVNDVDFGLAYSYLQGGTNLLSNSENEYDKYIFDYMNVPGSGITNTPDQPIEFQTINEALYNTAISIDIGQAAVSALKTLEPTLGENLTALAENVFNTVVSWIPGDLAGLIGQLIGSAELFQTFAQSSTPEQFEQSLQNLITAAENAAGSASPLSASAITDDESLLTNSIAETQGQVLGTSQPPPPSPQPVISAKASGNTQVGVPLALDSLFAPSISISGTNDTVDHYTLVNTLEGPGELVINNQVDTRGIIPDITPAEFQSAYFVSTQPGTDEIAIIAFDSEGNSSNEAETTITTSSGSSSAGASDLKVLTGALVNSGLSAGGGGTIAFTIENLGNQAAPATAISQIYLSKDATLDSSDILVSPGSLSDAGLASNTPQTEKLAFTLPSNVAGSYYLIVFAGDSSQVASGGAAGNTYAVPITVSATEPSPPAPLPPPSPPSGTNPLSITTDSAITTRVGSEPEITSGALNAIDADFSNAVDLRYTIVTAPKYGHLIDNFYTTSTFTQADIDNGLVDYVQDGTSTSSDSFSFYVSDPDGYRSATETLTFNILPSTNPPPRRRRRLTPPLSWRMTLGFLPLAAALPFTLPMPPLPERRIPARRSNLWTDRQR